MIRTSARSFKFGCSTNVADNKLFFCQSVRWLGLGIEKRHLSEILHPNS
jgi:hypothetical protein